MSWHDELFAVVGAELYTEMSERGAVILAQRPTRRTAIAALTALVATHPEVVDASIDDAGIAHIVFADRAVLHLEIDRVIVGTLVDPALRFSVGGFWEEGGGWIIGWQSADGEVFIQTASPTVSVTRRDNQPR